MTSSQPAVVVEISDTTVAALRPFVLAALGAALADLGGAVIDRVSRFCGRILEPVLASVERVPDELIIVAVGELAVLPFQAAVLSDGSPLLSKCRIRNALLGAQLLDERGDAAEASESTVGTGSSVILAPELPELVFCAAEATVIPLLRNYELTPAERCTRSGVSAALSRASRCHTACHGRAAIDARQTHLRLGADPADPEQVFPVGDAEQLRRFDRDEMFIAACSARTPGMEIPDEVLGFPNAFLGAGFGSVISAGWPVNDAAAGLTAMRYHELRGLGAAPAEALRVAQLWLRDLSPGSALDYLAELEQRLEAVGRPSDPVKVARRRLDSMLFDAPAGARPFAHAVHWGAFSIIGG